MLSPVGVFARNIAERTASHRPQRSVDPRAPVRAQTPCGHVSLDPRVGPVDAPLPVAGQAALEEIKAESGSDDIGFLVLDLADLQSVRDCAAAFDRDYGALTVLMNNAGVMAIPERQETKDGFEKQFGINHLGHFALTALLQGALRRGAEGGRAARVINVSSSASYGADAKAFDFDGPGGLMGPENYTQWGAYCQSKLANVMFTKELDERYKAAGVPITAVALHPGPLAPLALCTGQSVFPCPKREASSPIRSSGRNPRFLKGGFLSSGDRNPPFGNRGGGFPWQPINTPQIRNRKIRGPVPKSGICVLLGETPERLTDDSLMVNRPCTAAAQAYQSPQTLLFWR